MFEVNPVSIISQQNDYAVVMDVAQHLFGDMWTNDISDQLLFERIQHCLTMMHTLGIVVIASSPKSLLSCPSSVQSLVNSRWDVETQRLEAEKIWRKSYLVNAVHDKEPFLHYSLVYDNCDVVRLDDPDVFVIRLKVPFVRREGNDMPAGEPIGACLFIEFSEVAKAISGNRNTISKEQCLQEYVERIGRICTLMIIDAFRHREHRLSPFPARVSEHYWLRNINHNYTEPLQAKHTALPPGRDRHGARARPNVETVTLSLDLRKSTYCMEFAKTEELFGDWLDHLVEKMRAVAHLHGGVFDKFTGDGALIHFLTDECRDVYGTKPVEAAVNCAVDLQRAIERHITGLRKILHHDSATFGAGIAIDIGNAFWSYDFRGNPIVVGKGVVGACRVGDKARRKAIRLTNLAYYELAPSFRKKMKDIQQVTLEIKESPDSFQLQCWEFYLGDELDLGMGPAVIRKLCNKIKRKFSMRNPLQS